MRKCSENARFVFSRNSPPWGESWYEALVQLQYTELRNVGVLLFLWEIMSTGNKLALISCMS